MPKSVRDETQQEKVKKKVKQDVPLDKDPQLLGQFQLKCERPLPHSRTSEGADYCIRWMGPVAFHDLRRIENRDIFMGKINGAPLFYYKNKKYAARNVAYALVHREFGILSLSKSHHTRLSSNCGRPWCINPWHHHIRPPSKAKREAIETSNAEFEIMELINLGDERVRQEENALRRNAMTSEMEEDVGE